MQSGTREVLPPSTLDAASLWLTTTVRAGCGTSLDSYCMKNISAEKLLAAVPPTSVLPFGDIGGDSASTINVFRPAVDGKIVFASNASRTPAALPLLIGNTDNELGPWLALLPLFQDSIDIPPALVDTLIQQANLASFICPAAARAAKSVLDANPTWRYSYHGDFPNMRFSAAGPFGARHGVEIPELFGTVEATALLLDESLSRDSVRSTEEQREIRELMQGAWAAFAKDPERGLVEYGEGWPRYSSEGETLVRFGFENGTGLNLVEGGFYDEGCGVADVQSPSPTESEEPVETGSGHVQRPGISAAAALMALGLGILA